MIWPFSLPPSLPKYGRAVHFLDVDRAYDEFKYVIRVNERTWPDRDEFDLWCQLNLCYYCYDRVWYDKWRNRWESNGIGGGDAFFILTDNDETAVMAQLRWG